MTVPWYIRYFTADYWSVARHEYVQGRTDAEVAYLVEALEALAPGRRVLDLGCGIGRHAVGLARRGFQVIGLDVSTWALAEARAAADHAGVHVDWHQVDLLVDRTWPGGPADAAVCVQAFGWGTDAEQLRFLQTVRDHLRPGGVLIVDHSNVNAILRRYVPAARFEAPELVADFERSYDPLQGRSRGSLRVTYPDGGSVLLEDDVRLYQPPELDRMLRAAGFQVERVDADFVTGSSPQLDTRYVQFVARRRPHPADRPAIASYRAGSAGALDLRWSPDEVELVRPAIGDALRAVTGRSQDELDQLARRYAMDDPFGGARLAPVLSQHFGRPLSPGMVTAGAGTTGLLRALSTVGPGPVVHSRTCHPDLPRWARQVGAELIPADLLEVPGDAAEVLRRHRPAMLLVERPDVRGDFSDPAAIQRLTEVAAEAGSLLVVDEACANYAGPAGSVVRLVGSVDNLVVLRSMSKGYCCGGLRVGYAVTSAAVTAVRAVAPPLAVSELTFLVALGLLGMGDVLGRLRRRIAMVKPAVVKTLRAAGLDVRAGAPCLPWVVATADDAARGILERHAVLAREVDVLGAGGAPSSLLKIAVPLTAARVRAFHRAFPARRVSEATGAG